MTRVLVVEDEESFSDALSYMLRREGFEVAVCPTGPDAIEAFDRHGADLVLLDLMLPGLPGSEVCRTLRERSNVPVIMLTAKDSEIDKVVGLELGADDYVTKPFSSRELVARMRAVLRRRGEPDEPGGSIMESGPVRMDVDRHVVTVRGEQVQVPLKEFELLEVLLRNVGRVLVVEDEESFSDALSYMLRKEGFEVAVCPTGPDALDTFDRDGADLVLLDLMLPGLPGSEVCRTLRERSNVPVIMLTAKDSEIDKVVGLELGADDYVTKPFSSRELVARMRAVLRRRGEPEDAAITTLESGPVRMDVDRHVVTVRGSQVQLPLKEFELLEVLLRNTGRVLTRMQRIDRVWGADYVGDTKTLDVHIKRLRAKVELDPGNPRHIITVRGLGYKFEPGT